MSGRGARSPASVRAERFGISYAESHHVALANLRFEVAPGESLLVLGPSGSGKSTLARALAGLVGPGHGSEMTGLLEVDGLAVGRVPQSSLAERVGVVFQDPRSQLVMERVEDDVAFGLENRAWDRAAMRRRVPHALAAVGLAGYERRRSTRLSGGEQQRLALAGILAPLPGLLVLDEPTANLDPAGAERLMRHLGELRRARVATIILVEHRVELAWPLADRLLVLDADGRQLDTGAVEEVVARSGRRLLEEGVWLPEPLEERITGATTPWPHARARAGAALPEGAIVEARRLGFGYERGRPILEGIDLAISAGQRVALVGANGSGKSTLAQLLVGLRRATAGGVWLRGQRPERLPASKLARVAGYAFQDPEQQFLRLRVDEEIGAGLTPDEEGRVEPLMRAFGLPLERFAARSPYTLSGGEQRRLSLACVMVRKPSLLVLDEPTFGQDRRGYEALLSILDERVGADTALVAATHEMRLIRDLATRVVGLRDGRIDHDTPTAELLSRPDLLARLALAG